MQPETPQPVQPATSEPTAQPPQSAMPTTPPAPQPPMPVMPSTKPKRSPVKIMAIITATLALIAVIIYVLIVFTSPSDSTTTTNQDTNSSESTTQSTAAYQGDGYTITTPEGFSEASVTSLPTGVTSHTVFASSDENFVVQSTTRTVGKFDTDSLIANNAASDAAALIESSYENYTKVNSGPMSVTGAASGYAIAATYEDNGSKYQYLVIAGAYNEATDDGSKVVIVQFAFPYDTMDQYQTELESISGSITITN